jgi:magnesium-transporting ATPase (P-type)
MSTDCFICHTGTSDGVLYKTCPSTGCTDRWSHSDCLIHWVKQKHVMGQPPECGVCKQPYNVSVHINRRCIVPKRLLALVISVVLWIFTSIGVCYGDGQMNRVDDLPKITRDWLFCTGLLGGVFGVIVMFMFAMAAQVHISIRGDQVDDPYSPQVILFVMLCTHSALNVFAGITLSLIVGAPMWNILSTWFVYIMILVGMGLIIIVSALHWCYATCVRPCVRSCDDMTHRDETTVTIVV